MLLPLLSSKNQKKQWKLEERNRKKNPSPILKLRGPSTDGGE